MRDCTGLAWNTMVLALLGFGSVLSTGGCIVICGGGDCNRVGGGWSGGVCDRIGKVGCMVELWGTGLERSCR